MDLCGTADGIRLYNALRAQTVRVLYATFGQEKGNLVSVCVCMGGGVSAVA